MNSSKITLLSFLLVAFSLKAAADEVLYQTKSYSLEPTKVVEGKFQGSAESATKIVSTYRSTSTKDDNHKYTWTVKNDLSVYPKYTSPNLIEEALYNLGLDEMVNNIESDQTLRTGESWGGVWTRDVSYSIYLSISHLLKVPTKNSLLRKVDTKRGRIIQDTGTGGSWPVSTDRMVWTIAAWEYYKVYGEKDWLQMVYPYIKNSVETDRFNVYDEKTGLMKGESSFIDWREQSYPRWMQPADIAESKCLGTNAVHYETLVILSKMAEILGKEEDKINYAEKAESIKKAINKYLWLEEEGYYAQYLYGRNNDIVSERSETLGEALCILFDIASPEQQKRIIAQMPVTDYGPNIFYPSIPTQFSYHNNAVWPFVTSYWMLAAAKVGNQEGVKHAIGSTYRAAALFATNKENFTAETGDWTGTHTNSNNMLWSLAGNLSIVHRVLFGMSYETDKMIFNPIVPESFAGTRKLNNVKYRNATLSIEISGYGDVIKSFLLDGAETSPEIPETLTGEHTIKIELNNTFKNSDHPINLTDFKNSLAEPIAYFRGNKMSWGSIEGATNYIVLKDGKEITRQPDTVFTATVSGAYQVIAICEDDLLSSLASEPVVKRPGQIQIVETGGLRLGKNEIKDLTGKIVSGSTYTTNITIAEAGDYALDWLYSNGAEGILNDNKCGIRTMYVDGKKVGISIFPHRGKDEWTASGWSNAALVNLTAGTHKIELKFHENENGNMNWDFNDAIIYQLRVTSLATKNLPAEKDYNLISTSRADGIGKRIVNIHSSSGFNNNTENIYKLLIGAENVKGDGDKWYADNTESPWVVFSLSDIYKIDKIEWRDCNWYEIKHDVINSSEYWIYVSTTGTNPADWQLVAHEDNVIHQSIKSKVFDTPVEARYVKFALKPGGKDKKKIRIYGFDIYGELSQTIDRNGIVSIGKTVLDCSGYSSDRETPANLLDGLVSNNWNTTKTTSGSHWVTVDLENEYEINRFQIRDSSPYITGYNVYVSNEELSGDDAKWIPVVENATFSKTQMNKQVNLDEPVKARYVKLEIPRSKLAGNAVNIKEFEVYKTQGETAIEDVTDNKLPLFYPNPVSKNDRLFVSLSGDLKIFSMQGLLIQKQQVNGGQAISLSDLTAGVYVLALTDEEGNTKSSRIVVTE